jgi:hypothetical protein
MKIAYAPLFTVRLRHEFYASGLSTRDFAVEPTPWCRQLLVQYGWLFRSLADGFVVYAEIAPDTSPGTLRRLLGDEDLALTFQLRSLNPYLFDISKLDQYRPGKEVFYFNNLRDDEEEGQLYLGDNVAGARVGKAVELVTGTVYTYRFQKEEGVNGASLTLRDLSGKWLYSTSFRLPKPEDRITERRIDLTRIDGFIPGRDSMSDDQGGSRAFFYHPALSGRDTFAVIQLFHGSGAVPASYRFLDGDALTGVGAYQVQLKARKTVWRYVTIKKYESNSFALANLSINASTAFKMVPESAKRAVFESDEAILLAEKPQNIELFHNGTKLRSLPNPTLGTALKPGGDSGSFVSELFVYV